MAANLPKSSRLPWFYLDRVLHSLLLLPTVGTVDDQEIPSVGIVGHILLETHKILDVCETKDRMRITLLMKIKTRLGHRPKCP